MTPVIQYGFAGFSATMLGIIVWIMRIGARMTHEVTRVVDNNTSTIARVNDTVERHEVNASERSKETLTAVQDMREKLLARPCMQEK
jgi:hypothetical protein